MPSILIVDDNTALIQVTARLLDGLGQVRFATSGEAALRQMHRAPPDLVLLDAEMPEMDGYQVCQAMKADPVLSEIPVMFVTSHDNPEAELRGLQCGAVDFISKPINPPLLLARASTQLRLKRLTDELRRHATTDALTGLANRGIFEDRLRSEWLRSARTGTPLALVLLDVDHFKRFNDHYGHPAGDTCLRVVAGAIGSLPRRPGDLVARIGGEEFALLLPETTQAGARTLAEQVLAAVRGLSLPHADSPTASHVTVSIGIDARIAAPSAKEDERAQLVQTADQALYAAKADGRDRVALAPDGP